MATTETPTETEAERQVREEQEQFEREQAEQAAAADPPDGQIFDDTDYEREDLALPKVDGQGIDRIALKFSGTVFLDRSDPHDVALVRRLKLGQEVTLQVEGKVSAKAYKGATDREGELDVVVEELGIKVDNVFAPVIADEAA